MVKEIVHNEFLMEKIIWKNVAGKIILMIDGMSEIQYQTSVRGTCSVTHQLFILSIMQLCKYHQLICGNGGRHLMTIFLLFAETIICRQ